MHKRLTSLLIATMTWGMMSSFSVTAAVVEVEVKKFKFTPATITIHQGDTVKWVNKEKRQYHSVWFQELEPETDYFFPDESYEKTFNEVGVFNYICGPHPKMTGVVTVVE